jgi:hypothetical protein
MRQIVPVLFLVSVFVLLLSACGPSKNPAAKAVENYLTALVDKNSDRFTALSCAGWKANARLEYDSLQAVNTRLQGLSCVVTGANEATTDVVCQGKIIATYNKEDQQLDLSVRSYQVVRQGGEYLVCGYK